MPKLRFATELLEAGYSLLINPIIDFELSANSYRLSLFFTVPSVINDGNTVCNLEYLHPLKYKINETCYTGPIVKDNLAVVTCEKARSIVVTEVLHKCFQDSSNMLCPPNVFRRVHEVSFLGIPWNPQMRFSFARSHAHDTDCSDLVPLVHLGARYYLSCTDHNVTVFITTNNTREKSNYQLSPLLIIQLPCNFEIEGQGTGIGDCPEKLQLSIPIFTPDKIKYIPNKLPADSLLLNLHLQSLKIPPPLKFNKKTMESLDKSFNLIDGHLIKKLRKVEQDINKISENIITTVIEVLVYIAFPVSIPA